MSQEIVSNLERVEALVQQVDEVADPAVRGQIQEIVQGLLDYYGAGLERMLELVRERAGPNVLPSLAEDPLVSSLLLLHGLHPVELRARVEQALDSVRPFLKSHGGEVELVDVADGLVRLQMQGSCHGCPSSAITLKTRIEQAVYEGAPDVARIEVVEPTNGSAPAPASGFVPLAILSPATGG